MGNRRLTGERSRGGLTEIQALGEMFDPNVHEAVMTVAREKEQKDNEVVSVLRKGYMFKDKVLRPAMVQVAKDM
jgi:molecular chaperone GrpE